MHLSIKLYLNLRIIENRSNIWRDLIIFAILTIILGVMRVIFSFSVEIFFFFLVLEGLGMHAWCQSGKKVVKSPLFGSHFTSFWTFLLFYKISKGWSTNKSLISGPIRNRKDISNEKLTILIQNMYLILH